MNEIEKEELAAKAEKKLLGYSGYAKDVAMIVLNVADEKLREMIAEKDGLITQLRKISQAYSDQIAEKDAEIARLKTTDWAGVTETLTKSLAEKDAEIARLKQDAERYRKLLMLSVSYEVES